MYYLYVFWMILRIERCLGVVGVAVLKVDIFIVYSKEKQQWHLKIGGIPVLSKVYYLYKCWMTLSIERCWGAGWGLALKVEMVIVH